MCYLGVGVEKNPCPRVSVDKICHVHGAGIINGYLTIRYFMSMNTDLMILVPAGIRTR